MTQTELNVEVSISRIVHGMSRPPEWDMTADDIREFVQNCIGLGY